MTELGFEVPVCNRQRCPRLGLRLRWKRVGLLKVKGGEEKVPLIHIFQCGDGHSHYTGLHGEQVERLNGHGAYRYRDNVTGVLIETTCGTGKHNMSAESRQKLSNAIKQRFWSGDPEEKRRRVEQHTEAVRRAWADPVKRDRMVDANRRKSADPAYRQRMSKAHFNLSPEKKDRKSEGVRAARLRERKIINRVSQGAPATREAIFAEANRLHQSGRKEYSWSRLAHRLIPEEYRLNPEAARDRIKSGAKALRNRSKKGGSHRVQAQA